MAEVECAVEMLSDDTTHASELILSCRVSRGMARASCMNTGDLTLRYA